MYAKVSLEGTDIMIECDRVTFHQEDGEPERALIVVEKSGLVVFEIPSEKNLSFYIMNDNGKTIDSCHFRK